MKQGSFIDRCINDKQGNFALAQLPNAPLIGWLIFKLLSYLHVSMQIKSGFGFVSTAFIFTWAYMEIASGSTYLRRVFGVVVIVATLIPKFS